MSLFPFAKRLIKRFPFLYKSLVTILGIIGLRKRKHAYTKYGTEALNLFVRCMNENGFKYTLAFGSILGAIREHGFIKHDLDIDTFMWYEDYSPIVLHRLKEAGFSLYRSISINSGRYGREDTVLYKGVYIDIFYLYPPVDKYPYCCDFVPLSNGKRMPRRIEIPISKDSREALFEGISVSIPNNAEQICEFRYGPNYMTPDPNWHWTSAYNAITEWPEMIDFITVKKY